MLRAPDIGGLFDYPTFSPSRALDNSYFTFAELEHEEGQSVALSEVLFYVFTLKMPHSSLFKKDVCKRHIFTY